MRYLRAQLARRLVQYFGADDRRMCCNRAIQRESSEQVWLEQHTLARTNKGPHSAKGFQTGSHGGENAIGIVILDALHAHDGGHAAVRRR